MHRRRKREESSSPEGSQRQPVTSPDHNNSRPRKRNLDQSCCNERPNFKSEDNSSKYRDLNPLPVCPAAKSRMSGQESGSKTRTGPAESHVSSDQNPAVEEGGARCCELLDLVRGAGSSQREPPMRGDQEVLGDEGFPPESIINLFNSCRLQYEDIPLKITRSSLQYMYDDANIQYLDCVNSISHVGHCHPAIVEALNYSMDSFVTTCGWDIDRGDLRYPAKLQQTLPSGFDTFLFCNSGSEAVDLSIQLSRLYTCSTDAIVVDNAFHGSIDSVYALSPKVSKAGADWVHVIPMPDLYRGTYQGDDPGAIEKYLADTRELLDKAQGNGRKIACFIAEPMLTILGCIVPPGTWLQEMYKMVRECGGLCIADEVQTGLGRVGSHLWSFQAQNVVPDIIIIGKHIGNGYPMAAVVTSRDIAAVLGDRVKEYQCTSTMDAVGCAVLDIVHQEQLMNAAASVGNVLKEQLNILKKKHEYIGDVRGKGLIFGIEIVWSKHSKKPSRDIAEQIVYRMKEENIILANEGENRNILMLIPPMCFSQENALALGQKLDKVLMDLPSVNVVKELVMDLPTLSMRPASGTRDIRLGIRQPQEDYDDDNVSSMQDPMDLEYAQHCYQDLD